MAKENVERGEEGENGGETGGERGREGEGEKEGQPGWRDRRENALSKETDAAQLLLRCKTIGANGDDVRGEADVGDEWRSG